MFYMTAPSAASSARPCRLVAFALCGAAVVIIALATFEGAMREIQLEDAKATLSAVVDQAVQGTPSIITRHGRKEAVILSLEAYERLAHAASFGYLLAAFPGEPADIPERVGNRTRPIDL